MENRKRSNKVQINQLSEEEKSMLKELESLNYYEIINDYSNVFIKGFYDWSDLGDILQLKYSINNYTISEKLEKILLHDEQREKDGFPKRIKISKLIKPSKINKEKFVIIPTVSEAKFYHDEFLNLEEASYETGGSGDYVEGEVIGKESIIFDQNSLKNAKNNEKESEHILSEAFELGKILTNHFKLPNIQRKGRKKNIKSLGYDITNRNYGFGQFLDKKASLNKIVKNNIQLGFMNSNKIDIENLLINPSDQIYHSFSEERIYETQAIVFFLRDYSGSMSGEPTETVTSQHFFIYNWLAYQYKNNIESRFILHDTSAKEVNSFYTYCRASVSGGTKVVEAYRLVNEIIQKSNLQKNYNIYVFHGTDGDDWDHSGRELIESIKNTVKYVNRIGITIAKNNWIHNNPSIMEKHLLDSGLLNTHSNIVKMNSFKASDISEKELIKNLEILIS